MARRTLPRIAWAALLAATVLIPAGCGSHTPQGVTNYVALGDSYTAFPGSSSQVSAPCLRSSQNYPHLVASALHYNLVDMSCSGATTTNFISSQNADTAPQFAALNARTQVVTVSIGANDSQFSSLLLGGCVSFRSLPAAQNNPCEVSTFGEAARALEVLKPTLITTYRAIRVKAPHARVIVVGYPEILGDAGACPQFPLAPGDVAYVNTMNAQLNSAVQQAAAIAGVEYLDISTASRSHGICSSDPWINGMTTVPGKAFAVHPFANEQQAVALLLEHLLQRTSPGRSPATA